MSHHPRCVHAHYAEAAHQLAMQLEPPKPIALGPITVNMTSALATLIDLACPGECIQGVCAHEPKRGSLMESLP